jgi:hypothetical protein
MILLKIKRFLKELFFFHCIHNRENGLQFIFTLPGNIKLKGNAMSIELNDSQFEILAVVSVNAAGTQTPLSVAPDVSSSNTSVATVEVAPDGVSIKVSAVTAGTTTVTATALGFTATMDVTVVSSPAVGIEILPGTPQEK